jgi:hypothetical protein
VPDLGGFRAGTRKLGSCEELVMISAPVVITGGSLRRQVTSDVRVQACPASRAISGAFRHQVLASMAALSLAWTAAFALLGLAVLRLRLPQPAHRPQRASGTSRQARTAAGPGTPLAGPDGSRSTAPVTSPAPHRGPGRPSRQLSPQRGKSSRRNG